MDNEGMGIRGTNLEKPDGTPISGSLGDLTLEELQESVTAGVVAAIRGMDFNGGYGRFQEILHEAISDGVWVAVKEWLNENEPFSQVMREWLSGPDAWVVQSGRVVSNGDGTNAED